MNAIRAAKSFCLAAAVLFATVFHPAEAALVRFFSATTVDDGMGGAAPLFTSSQPMTVSIDGGTPSTSASELSLVFDYDVENKTIVRYAIRTSRLQLLNATTRSNGFNAPEFVDDADPSFAADQVFRLTPTSESPDRFFFRQSFNNGDGERGVILSFSDPLTAAGGRVEFTPLDFSEELDGGPLLSLTTLQSSDVLLNATTLFFSDTNTDPRISSERYLAGPTSDDLALRGGHFLYGVPLTTIPEPSSLACWLGGSVLMLARRRRQC